MKKEYKNITQIPIIDEFIGKPIFMDCVLMDEGVRIYEIDSVKEGISKTEVAFICDDSEPAYGVGLFEDILSLDDLSYLCIRRFKKIGQGEDDWELKEQYSWGSYCESI